MKCPRCKKEVLKVSSKLCVSCTLAEEEAVSFRRYKDAAQAVQAGVAMTIELGDKDTEPKHLRVGLNVVMCDLAALVELLSKKGCFEMHEYAAAIANKMEDEKHRYEEMLSLRMGTKVTLV